ncbi:uncharacterized protein LOC125777180 isoform X1 [Bactrocera dorsalis]|uniref:Uncharacterized protein LOC125777180 isoform X1 n=2 Tax=Bactrocera dorsalis TaxID=27457 RepID=A0ABM3JDV8_BACDO|nr:uncharacterized protein LOC125777180 isoform X1 [Bactrocera dorsalis]
MRRQQTLWRYQQAPRQRRKTKRKMFLFKSQIPDSDFFIASSEFTNINTTNNTKLEEKLVIIIANQNIIKRQQAETLAMFKQLFEKDVGSYGTRSVFPLSNLEALKKLNADIVAGSSADYIKIIKNIIGKTGIIKSIEGIFERSLIVQLNYDGIHSKYSLKECKGLIDCLFEASMKEG